MKGKISNINAPINLLIKNNFFLKNRSIDEIQITQFVKDLAILMNAAVPLFKALKILSNQQKNSYFKIIIKNLADLVHSGIPFSSSLLKYPQIFDTFFVHMIKAGEASSDLNIALETIAKYKEREIKLKKKLKTIMIYPSIVIGISIIILSLLFLFLIPKFEIVFNNIIDLNSIPFSTKIIISISHLFTTIILWVICFIALSFCLIKIIKKSIKDNLLLKIPFIGNIIRDINISLFSRILGVLINNAIPLSEALKISQNIIKNDIIRNTISHIHQGIREGETLSFLLEKEGKFSEIAISLIHIGEETGTLSKMLLEIANKFDDTIEAKLEKLTAYCEPLIILILAVIIGLVVISLFLPLIDIMNNIVTF